MPSNPTQIILEQIRGLDMNVYERIETLNGNVTPKKLYDIVSALTKPKVGKISPIGTTDGYAHKYDLYHLTLSVFKTQRINSDEQGVIQIENEDGSVREVKADHDVIKLFRTVLNLGASRVKVIHATYLLKFQIMINIINATENVTKEDILKAFVNDGSPLGDDVNRAVHELLR